MVSLEMLGETACERLIPEVSPVGLARRFERQTWRGIGNGRRRRGRERLLRSGDER
jgi:hypothetical protein